MARFQIIMGGQSLGPISLDGTDWPPGSVISRGDRPDLRVVEVIPSDDLRTFTTLVVESE